MQTRLNILTRGVDTEKGKPIWWKHSSLSLARSLLPSESISSPAYQITAPIITYCQYSYPGKTRQKVHLKSPKGHHFPSLYAKLCKSYTPTNFVVFVQFVIAIETAIIKRKGKQLSRRRKREKDRGEKRNYKAKVHRKSTFFQIIDRNTKEKKKHIATMASSFRIKLKLGNNKNGQESSSKQQSLQSSPNRNLISPSRSNSAFERGGSSIVDDGSSVLSEDIAEDEEEEEEEDELEDSPPPPEQMNQSKDGKTRKLSGAAAMKSANKKSKHTTASSTGGTPGAAGSDREASTSTSRRGSQELSPTPSGSGGSRKRISMTNEYGKPIDEMSMAEIEALPAAKRRKGMKLRGAAGPGRGWRKGLKMDMKPVYRAPGDSPPSQMISGTPSSFGQKPKSALARDALSKANTPMRSESPNDGSSSVGDASRNWEDISGSVGGNTSTTDVKPSKAYPASSAAVAARRARAAGLAGSSDIRKEAASNTNTHSSTPNPVPPPVKQSVPTLQEEGKAIRAIIRGGPPVLPPPKIPIGFVTPGTLDKNTTSKFTRKWQKSGREILSLGGRVWSSVSWLSTEANKFPTSAELKANASNTTNPTSSNANNGPGTNTPALTGSKSALATGNVTPAITSRAPSPVPSNGTTGDQTGKSSPIMGKGTLAPPLPPTTTTPKPSSNSAKQLSSPSAGDWRGSSAAFTAANRNRS